MASWCYWAAVFFLFDAMEAFGFIDRMIYGTWEGKGGDKITQALNVLLIAASASLFVQSYRIRKKGFSNGTTLAFAAVAFLFLTALWSTSPPTTIRVSFVYLFIIIGAVGMARTFEADAFMRLLSRVCLCCAIASIALLVVSPGNALMGGVDYIGIFPHKNVLGQVMATGALATLHDIRVARRAYFGKSLKLTIFIVMAFASKSTAAWLATLVFCSISAFFALWRKGGFFRMIGASLAAILAPIFLLAMAAPDAILQMIGKDPTLTGRTEIWAYVINDIWMKPLLGWGYFGFWGPENPAAVEISDAVHWMVPQAHNGLLEFLLNVGLVGTSIFLFLLLRTVVLAWQCLKTPARALAISTLTICIGIILEGISETVLLAPTESLTPILFITGLMCERSIWLAKQLPRSRLGC